MDKVKLLAYKPNYVVKYNCNKENGTYSLKISVKKFVDMFINERGKRQRFSAFVASMKHPYAPHFAAVYIGNAIPQKTADGMITYNNITVDFIDAESFFDESRKSTRYTGDHDLYLYDKSNDATAAGNELNVIMNINKIFKNKENWEKNAEWINSIIDKFKTTYLDETVAKYNNMKDALNLSEKYGTIKDYVKNSMDKVVNEFEKLKNAEEPSCEEKKESKQRDNDIYDIMPQWKKSSMTCAYKNHELNISTILNYYVDDNDVPHYSVLIFDYAINDNIFPSTFISEEEFNTIRDILDDTNMDGVKKYMSIVNIINDVKKRDVISSHDCCEEKGEGIVEGADEAKDLCNCDHCKCEKSKSEKPKKRGGKKFNVGDYVYVKKHKICGHITAITNVAYMSGQRALYEVEYDNSYKKPNKQGIGLTRYLYYSYELEHCDKTLMKNKK